MFFILDSYYILTLLTGSKERFGCFVAKFSHFSPLFSIDLHPIFLEHDTQLIYRDTQYIFEGALTKSNHFIGIKKT